MKPNSGNQAKQQVARRQKWMTRKWQQSRAGNEFLTIEGQTYCVFPNKLRHDEWKIRIDAKLYPGVFATPEEAKLALFEEYWRSTYAEPVVSDSSEAESETSTDKDFTA